MGGGGTGVARMARLPTRFLFAGAAILVGVCALFLWLIPSHDYLFTPNAAQPLAGKVEVAGGEAAPAGGIYYVDVTIRRASWLERLLSFARPDGASLVPEAAVVPEGTTIEERREAAQTAMVRSKEVAAAVALREAGYEVDATPEGVLVEGVAADVPAASALEAGDVIVAAAGRPVQTPGALRARVGRLAPGSDVALTLRRRDRSVRTTVRTVEDPLDRSRSIIGIRVSQAAAIDLPLAVEIDLGDVGGPSAGLPFALEILEQLGTDVDRGCRVAATGELELDGSVRPVGGLKQKTFGAREAGVDVFVVPAGDNAQIARRHADGLHVVAVESFQQALHKLRTLEQKC